MDQLSARTVIFTGGMLLLFLAGAMVVPMLADLAIGTPDWRSFALSASITAFTGGLLVLSTRGTSHRVSGKTAYLLTVSAWCLVAIFASLPLLFSSLRLSVTDAIFETISGLTTTGSTVIVGLDTLPNGLVLWRSLLQWIGGVGIVVMAILLLPMLQAGGMQLFRTESSDISGRPVGRPALMVSITVLVYFGLTLACTIAYGLAGMNAFDAINHAMTTLSTGGYSTKDASIGFYNSVPIEAVGIVFMVAGALPLIWYARLFLERRKTPRPEGQQVRVFLAILVVAVFLATAWNVHTNGMPFGHALRVSAFNVTSILTDTGFATTDFSAWGSFAVGLFFTLYLVGGCAGSTAGGIKVFRWQILFSGMVRQLKMMYQPDRILLVRYGNQKVEIETEHSVRNFFLMYIATLLALSLLVMATGLDFVSSISAVAQAMANAGPGLGPIVGPATNFASLPDTAKWCLMAGMLVGRLELATVYVLLLRDFWQS